MNDRTFYPSASSVMLLALAAVNAASCANGRNPGSSGAASAAASSTLDASPAPARSAMTTNGNSDGGRGNGDTPSAASAGAIVRAPLPEELLRSIVGCWRLDEQEEWTINRTEEGGARVARKLLAVSDSGTSYARRAAVPSDIAYEPGAGTLAFSTAGPHHALLFVFSVGSAGLTGSWATSRAPGVGYHLTGSVITLRPCPKAR
jgi:hypothetical protein